MNLKAIFQQCITDLGFTEPELLGGYMASVYRVRNGDAYQTIKFASDAGGEAPLILEIERDALSRAQGIQGVAQKISYHTLRCEELFVHALVSEYIPGNTLAKTGKCLDTAAKSYLEETLAALHQRRMTHFDLVETNIIVGVLPLPFLIELGAVQFQDGGVNKDAFDKSVQNDIILLQSLFRRYGL